VICSKGIEQGSLALMTEELGEIAECVTKGRAVTELSEECADLLILLMGNSIAAGFDLNQAFWDKMAIIESRDALVVEGRVRVTAYQPNTTTERPQDDAD